MSQLCDVDTPTQHSQSIGACMAPIEYKPFPGGGASSSPLNASGNDPARWTQTPRRVIDGRRRRGRVGGPVRRCVWTGCCTHTDGAARVIIALDRRWVRVSSTHVRTEELSIIAEMSNSNSNSVVTELVATEREFFIVAFV